MEQEFPKRLNIMILAILILLLMMVFRLGMLQIVFGTYYRQSADENRFRQIVQLAPRGNIVDSRGVVLASNEPGYFVSMYHTRAPELEQILERLVMILDPAGADPEITVAAFKSRFHANRFRRWQPVRLTDSPLSFHDPRLLLIEEGRLALPGVFVEVQPVRSYPLGGVASHILGGLGRFTGGAQELRTLVEAGLTGYRLDSRVGRWGVEAAFEFVAPHLSLRGIDGSQVVEVDKLSRLMREVESIEPLPGNNVHLTIDAMLQQNIETWLVNEYLPNLRATTAPLAREAAVVALDPRDGRILAFISVPAFAPAYLSRDFTALSADPDRPLEAKPLVAAAPGSIFKPITEIAGMVSGAKEQLGQRPPVVCTGRLHDEAMLGPRGKRCWVEQFGTGHGQVTDLAAMRVSCNIYFYQLSFELLRSLGTAHVLDQIADVAAFFGLGVRSSLPELVGFRSDTGTLPTSEGFREGIRAHLRRNPFDRRPLNPYPGEVADIAIGQGAQSYTPLQVANFMAMLATGHRFQPFIVDRVVSVTGQVMARTNPELLASLVRTPENQAGLIDDAQWRHLKEGLRQVTQVTGLGLNSGTASGVFRGAPYFSAGKTGTAEVMQGGRFVDSHGWFAGWAATDAISTPEIVVSVLVKHGRSGGSAAAPIARRVLDEYFRLKLARAGQ